MKDFLRLQSLSIIKFCPIFFILVLFENDLDHGHIIFLSLIKFVIETVISRENSFGIQLKLFKLCRLDIIGEV